MSNDPTTPVPPTTPEPSDAAVAMMTRLKAWQGVIFLAIIAIVGYVAGGYFGNPLKVPSPAPNGSKLDSDDMARFLAAAEAAADKKAKETAEQAEKKAKEARELAARRLQEAKNMVEAEKAEAERQAKQVKEAAEQEKAEAARMAAEVRRQMAIRAGKASNVTPIPGTDPGPAPAGRNLFQ